LNITKPKKQKKMRFLTKSHIVGIGLTRLGKLNKSATTLMEEAIEIALADAKCQIKDLEGIITAPSLSEPRFMHGHFLATRMGLLPQKGNGVVCRTLDTGGASPISALLEADKLIKNGCDLVAIVAGDSIASMPTREFLERADVACADPDGGSQSPVIPLSYDRIAKWHMAAYGVDREVLAMVPVLMSTQAPKHPYALTRTPLSLNTVLNSKKVGDVTNLLECARRADGAGAVIIASTRFLQEKLQHVLHRPNPVIIGGGEASGPLYVPKVIDESIFSCEIAASNAYVQAQVGVSDIDFFGLYDCFPICFLRALEAVGIAPKGRGGEWIKRKYEESEASPNKMLSPDQFPINTHGGLLSFGAPFEVPALFSVIEAVQQLRGTAEGRQVTNARRALVYGNGGVFSASSVCILGRGEY
jgi:acetyl-CoA acetyltransferase